MVRPSAKRTFKFNHVVVNPPSKETIYLCQLERDSKYSENYYYYGYLFKGSKNTFSNYYSVKLELERVIENQSLYVYDTKDQDIEGVHMFNCFIRSKDSFENSYHLSEGIYYLFHKSLSKEEVLMLQQKQDLKPMISDETEEDYRLHQAKKLIVQPQNIPDLKIKKVDCPDFQKKKLELQSPIKPSSSKDKYRPTMQILNEVKASSTLQQIAATTNKSTTNLRNKNSRRYTPPSNLIKKRIAENTNQNKELSLLQKLKKLIKKLFK